MKIAIGYQLSAPRKAVHFTADNSGFQQSI
jgi:hypothetical protein